METENSASGRGSRGSTARIRSEREHGGKGGAVEFLFVVAG